MAIKLPQANLAIEKYTDSQLISRAAQVAAGLLAAIVDFPTPPVLPAALTSLITAYRNAAAAALKGTKTQTETKDLAKKDLILALKQDAIYVTQVAQSLYTPGSPLSIIGIRRLILSSGFAVSIDPTPVENNQGIKAPIIRKAISEDSGTLKILVRQYTDPNRNTKLWQVNYRISASGTTSAGPWQSQTFTSQNQILLTNLDSGVSYDWQIAAIPGRDTKRNIDKPLNFTAIAKAIII